MPSTKDRLQDDVKAALKAGDRARLGVLRMVMAAIKQREVDSRETLDETAVLSILEKMVKQRQDAIGQFERGGRSDLVAKETAEIDVIRTYLPEPLDEAAVTALIDAAIAETGAAAPSDMGRVMAEIKKNAAGRVDMGEVSKLVRARLSAS
ncbi:MAG: GatB/YqeY domain-containing protein [Gammaproteobacteria bacterium]|nr:GatB/YqeY domain-containing protein [Gammaproteobacteria bacterium]